MAHNEVGNAFEEHGRFCSHRGARQRQGELPTGCEFTRIGYNPPFAKFSMSLAVRSSPLTSFEPSHGSFHQARAACLDHPLRAMVGGDAVALTVPPNALPAT
jgi:hypothetical protein